MDEAEIPFIGPIDCVDEQGRRVDHKEFNPEKGIKERADIERQYADLITAFRKSSSKILGITKSGQNAMGPDINSVEREIEGDENIHFYYN